MSGRELSEELLRKAVEELGEVPTRLQADIEHLRNWISKQPHLNVKQDDRSFLNFLRVAKFSLKKAKERMEKYYTVKSTIADFFAERDPFSPNIQEVLNRGVVTLVSDPSDPVCPVLILCRWGKTYPDRMTVVDIFKVILMTMDIAMNEYDSMVINGYDYVSDLESGPAIYLTQLTPTKLKQISLSLTDTYPIRLKGYYLVNAPQIAQTLVNVYRSIGKDKIKERVHISDNLGPLVQKIPLSVLPNEYGGTAGPVEDLSAQWKKKVENYREWFLEDDKYRNDETKRLEESKSPDELIGIDGSFRTLQVD